MINVCHISGFVVKNVLIQHAPLLFYVLHVYHLLIDYLHERSYQESICFQPELCIFRHNFLLNEG